MTTMKFCTIAPFLVSLLASSAAFVPYTRQSRSLTFLRSEPIVSPFDDSVEREAGSVATTTTADVEGTLDLTWENVDLVLDGMRPYLMQDGGNVKIAEIDGPVVRLELEVRS